MSTNIDGKVVVLTGGSAGLGEDAARYLAAGGGEHNADLQSCQQGPSQKLESMQSVAFQRAKSAVRSESRVL